MWLGNPRKKVQGILKKIEKGTASEADMAIFGEMLEKEEALAQEAVASLISILRNSDPVSMRQVIRALNDAADIDAGMMSGSVDVIADFLKKDLNTAFIRQVLEIIEKINRKNPEKMNSAVPGLLASLRNRDKTVRENTYSLLCSVSIIHPEFFKGLTREINLALNGLNLDERIHACRIIKNIANRDVNIVENTYDNLTYLESNHPSRELRIEAASALEKFKSKKKIETPAATVSVRSDSGMILNAAKKDAVESRALAGYVMKPKENTSISGQLERIISGTDIEPPVLESVFNIAVEISREGREGKPVGTAFIIGNSKEVLARSKQLIYNPVEGIPAKERMITDPDFSNTIKELAQLDGAFVINGAGLVEAACRYLTADASNVNIPRGFGTKHVSSAAMTMATKAVGIVVSESGGRITIFKNGMILGSF